MAQIFFVTDPLSLLVTILILRGLILYFLSMMVALMMHMSLLVEAFLDKNGLIFGFNYAHELFDLIESDLLNFFFIELRQII